MTDRRTDRRIKEDERMGNASTMFTIKENKIMRASCSSAVNEMPAHARLLARKRETKDGCARCFGQKTENMQN